MVKKITEKSPKSIPTVDAFTTKLIDICWSFVIAKPALALQFNVKGKRFEDIKGRFKIHTLKEEVKTDKEEEIERVHIVAWPCIEMGTRMWNKGSVVVFKRR